MRDQELRSANCYDDWRVAIFANQVERRAETEAGRFRQHDRQRQDNPSNRVSVFRIGSAITNTFERPAGWSIEWYDQTTQSVARIYRTEAQGSEAIVISPSKLSEEFHLVAANEVYASEDFKHLAKMLNASIHVPDDSMKWDGLYLEYPLPPSVQITQYKINVRNWFMVTESHLVQFQCYYVFNPALTVEQQSIVHHKLDAAYLEILQSVKRTS